MSIPIVLVYFPILDTEIFPNTTCMEKDILHTVPFNGKQVGVDETSAILTHLGGTWTQTLFVIHVTPRF